MSLRCIVADDEPLAKMLIETYIHRTDGLESVGAYTSAPKALEAIAAGGIDLAFLDIQMPGISGLQLAVAAKETGTRVVFTTAYRDYAIEGFRLNALDYLLKPISYEEFLVSAQRAINSIGPRAETAEPTFITVKSNYRSVKIDFADIIYVEGLRDYVKIHVRSNRPVITQGSMKNMTETLPANLFVRIHRSYIVAKSAIKSYGRNLAAIEGPEDPQSAIELPIGETYRANFLKQMET